jgi:hypothetical protein
MTAGNAWAEWQRDHAAALAALQEAQRAYHRVAMAGALSGGGAQSVEDRRRSSLELLDAARTKLDQVRARMPGA